MQAKSPRQRVLNMLERLPDDVSYGEIQYHAYVLEQLEQGLAEADAGLGIPHDEVKRRLRKKWLHGEESR